MDEELAAAKLAGETEVEKARAMAQQIKDDAEEAVSAILDNAEIERQEAITKGKEVVAAAEKKAAGIVESAKAGVADLVAQRDELNRRVIELRQKVAQVEAEVAECEQRLTEIKSRLAALAA